MNKLFKLIALLCILTDARAQQTFPVNGVTDPKHIKYVFTNATIFTDFRTSVSQATMIIQDGVIISIGQNIMIPSDGVIINLNGKNIYPSFIDIFTDYGLPEVKKPVPSDAPQMSSAVKGAYNWNQAVHPEYDAVK